MRFSRRRAIIGGAALLLGGVGVGGGLTYGDEFEEHVAATLGLERRLTGELLDSLRTELDGDYAVRAAGFAVATTVPSRWLTPEAVRREAIEAFVGPLFGLYGGFLTAYTYAGLTDTGFPGPCVLSRS